MSDKASSKPFRGPDMQFWENCYRSGKTPWERNRPNPQLESWIRTGRLSPIIASDARPGSNDDSRVVRVLVPGCGSGQEVVLLAEWGFDVVGLDYAPAAVAQARDLLRALLTSRQSGRVARAEVLQADLFEYAPEVAFDAVYDQQCLVAIHPSRWPAYADRLHQWLRPDGELLLVLDHDLTQAVAESQARAGEPRRGPPYDLSLDQLKAVFSPDRWEWPDALPGELVNAQGQIGLVLTRL
ncbi:MAG: methyltransferase domain-containing protein [Lautropia sp.]|nr:methyltransferase domain-containing protein [Lautropia sp.]